MSSAHHVSNLVQLALALFLHALRFHDLAHSLHPEHLLQLAGLPRITLGYAGTLHRAEELRLRHLGEETLLHLDVLRQVLHILGERDIHGHRGIHDCRRLSANATAAWTFAQRRADAAVLQKLIVKKLVRIRHLLLLNPELSLLPLEFLKLQLFL